jgi:autotransporter-associated beta strand protein
VSNLNLTGGTFVANAFTLLAAGNTNTSSITIGGTADVTLPALPTVRGTGSIANLTLDGGTLRPLASSASYISGLTNAFLTSNGAKLNVGDGINITISQVLANAPSQAGTFLKEGTGRLVLTGANTFTGGIVVNGGRLEITGTNATSVPVNVNGGAISFSPAALANVTTFNIGATQDGALDLLYDGAAANWTVPSGVTINLGGATSSGALGFNLGSNTATSDQMIFSPGSSLVLNAGGGRINGSALGGLTVGSSYDVVTGATITGPGTFEPGNLPSGFTYNVSTSLGTVTLNVAGQAAAGDLYWKGGVNSAWGGLGGGGTTSNWSSTSDGLTGTNYGPGANNFVIFSADAIAAPVTTTLDSAVSVQGIRFLSTATPSVSILPGASGTLTLGKQARRRAPRFQRRLRLAPHKPGQ